MGDIFPLQYRQIQLHIPAEYVMVQESAPHVMEKDIICKRNTCVGLVMEQGCAQHVEEMVYMGIRT